ncbi:MAG: pseudouridine synthase [Pseudomonadota bacterium]
MSKARQPGERLQKYLSSIGVGSRRKVDSWIAEGRVRVNGQVAQPGIRVTEKSRISIDGKPVRARAAESKTRFIIYNKPEGEICTRSDPQNRPTVFRQLPRLKGERWVVVGRLDINTRGLLLFTNSGSAANRLMHPSNMVEREYLCRVFGEVNKQTVERLLEGIAIDGRKSSFLKVKRQRGEGRNTWYKVVLTQGRYREVRRLWEKVGCQVNRLVRIRYGPVELPRSLRQGQWSELSAGEVNRLMRPPRKGDAD